MREIVNAIFYVPRSGCSWWMVPDCFAPASTVYRWFMRLRDDGVFETMNHRLMMRNRERQEREAIEIAFAESAGNSHRVA